LSKRYQKVVFGRERDSSDVDGLQEEEEEEEEEDS